VVTGSEPFRFRIEDIRLPGEETSMRTDLAPSGQTKIGEMRSVSQPMSQPAPQNRSHTVTVQQDSVMYGVNDTREAARQAAAIAAAREAAAFEAARKAEIAQQTPQLKDYDRLKDYGYLKDYGHSVVGSSGQIAPAANLTPHQMLVRSDLVSYFALGGTVLGIVLGVYAHSK
jgi:hypothetical protein